MNTEVRPRHPPRRFVLFAGLLILCSFARWSEAGPKDFSSAGTATAFLAKTQIFGQDDRTAVFSTTRYPFSAVGRVLSYYATEIHAGTGAMIGDSTVLTAAHVVYDQTLGAPTSIQFIPGANGSSQPFGVATVVRTDVPEPWTQSGDENFDIAVLTLDNSVGGQTGMLPFGNLPESTLANQTLRSAGYPADLDNGTTMYSAPGPFLGIDGNMLLEEIDTEPGQSGSPIWYQSGPDITVVATLIGTRQTTETNGTTNVQGVGCYISSDINTWIIAAMNGTATPALGTRTLTTSPCGICGIGTGQALVAVSLCWAGCFLVRKRRW